MSSSKSEAAKREKNSGLALSHCWLVIGQKYELPPYHFLPRQSEAFFENAPSANSLSVLDFSYDIKYLIKSSAHPRPVLLWSSGYRPE